MEIVTWLVVGLVAGVLASLSVRSLGFGLLGDIVLGIAGAPRFTSRQLGRSLELVPSI